MAACMMTYDVSAFGLSDVGRIRQNNEDVWAELPEIPFYVLADGMGGHQAGEIAAREAVLQICEIAREMWTPAHTGSFHDMRRIMEQAIQQVNNAVYQMSRANEQLKGMGTTLCCIYFHDKGMVYGHVGDSRIYRWRRRRLEQMTKDHSLYRELIDQGHLQEHSTDFLYRNIITKAIGTEAHVKPSVHLNDIADGDLYLMCSDGLSDLLSIREIQAIINQGASIEETVQELVETANARGGFDNITVLMIKVSKNNAAADLS